MKKIPTLFKRVFENHRIKEVLNEITPGCEEAFTNGIATIKYDGSCCMIDDDGNFYKRYDAKKGKKPPEGAIPCCDPDPITGHWPHWVKIDFDNPKPEDKWFIHAYINSSISGKLDSGTYEAIGPHFQANPHDIDRDILIRHGTCVLDVYRDFESIRYVLNRSDIEGLVFWLNGEPVCKIKRTDFGYEWPIKKEGDV